MDSFCHRIKEEVLRQERLAHYNELRLRERQTIADIAKGPSIAEVFSQQPQPSVVNNSESSQVSSDANESKEQSKIENRSQNSKISFREITQVRNLSSIC